MAQGLTSLEASSLEGLIYTINNAADIAAFSALFSTESALFLVILMILLVAMLGAIILATKSMETENSSTDQMEVVSGTASSVLSIQKPLCYFHARHVSGLNHH